jgi:uncharacterized membrane protein YccC
VILGTAGIVGGFYFGWFFPSPWVGLLLTAVCSFLALAVTRVSFGLLIGIIFFLFSYPWGVMHADAGHLIANEKLIGELVGVVVAVAAIAVLARLQKGDDEGG